jgi:hypothetical protein
MSELPEMHACDFDAGVSPRAALEAFLQGAQSAWGGPVTTDINGDGDLLVRFNGDGGDASPVEACAVLIAVLPDDRVRLISVVVHDAVPTGGACTWNAHCLANDALNAAPARPLDEAAAHAAYQEVRGRFLTLGDA